MPSTPNPETRPDPAEGFYRLNTDGSGTGTLEAPAQGAIGCVLRDPQGNIVPGGEISEWIGPATNTVAEYWALIEGLRLAQFHGIHKIDVRVDSSLLVDQVKGTSKVTKEYLRPFHRRVCALLQELGEGNYTLEWVDRKENSDADRLATQGLTKRPEGA